MIGCGQRFTFGHGEHPTCGKPFYDENPWLCEACKLRRASAWVDITKKLPPIGPDLLVKWREGRITAAVACSPCVPEQKIDFCDVGMQGAEREWLWDDWRDPYDGVTHWRLMVEGPDAHQA